MKDFELWYEVEKPVYRKFEIGTQFLNIIMGLAYGLAIGIFLGFIIGVWVS